MTLEDVILEYNNLKKLLGHPPSSSEFFRNSGISKRALGKFLNNEAWSKLVRLSGDIPKAFSSPKSSFEDILTQYGNLARQIGRLPLIVDWDNAKQRPSVSGIEKSHNIKWSEISNKFYHFVQGKSEWEDILSLFQMHTKLEIKAPVKDECFVYLMLDTKNNFYKIGISKTAGFREKTLQSEKPSIKLIAAKKFVNRRIAANFEKALHDSYSHKRKRGEWFLLDSEDLNEIKTTLDS